MEPEALDTAECRLSTHNFNSVIFGTPVHFSVLKMQDSFMLWVGSKPAELTNLAMAMATKFDAVPMVTSIMGDASNPSSSSLSQKLSRRSKKQVFVSYNLPTGDGLMMPEVEKKLIEEMTVCPEKF